MATQPGQSNIEDGERISDLTEQDLAAACADMTDDELLHYITPAILEAYKRGWEPSRILAGAIRKGPPR